jgi:40S ribosome biogenesis protein Tsr1 and BMS1 C-terminal
VYLKDVPQEAASQHSAYPIVIFGLLQHEHKKSTLNFAVQRNTEYEGSVRSKVTKAGLTMPFLADAPACLGSSRSLRRTSQTAC